MVVSMLIPIAIRYSLAVIVTSKDKTSTIGTQAENASAISTADCSTISVSCRRTAVA